MHNLEIQQQELQEEASEVLEKLSLVNTISEFGTVSINGSYKTELMTWPDIDLDVVGNISDETFFEIAKTFFYQRELVKSVTLSDYRKGQNPDYPKGLYLGMKCTGKKWKSWKIDIWFTLPNKRENLDDWVLQHLTPEKRLIILEIKNDIADHPKYRKEILSIDIYKAVLENHVTTLDEFKSYLKTIGKEL